MTMATLDTYTTRNGLNTLDYPLRSFDPVYILFKEIIFKVYLNISGFIPIPILSLHSIFQEKDYIRRLLSASSIISYSHSNNQYLESDIISGRLFSDKIMLRAKFKQLGPSFHGNATTGKGNGKVCRPLSFQLPRSSSYRNSLNGTKRPLSLSFSDIFQQRNSSLLVLDTETKSSFHNLMDDISSHFILPPQFDSPVKKLIEILKRKLKKKKKSHSKKLNRIRYSQIERPNPFNSSVNNKNYDPKSDSIGDVFHMRSEDRKILDTLLDQFRSRNIPIPYNKYERLVREYKEKILPVYFQTPVFLENSETKTDFAKYCKLNMSKIIEKYPTTEERFSLFFTVAMRQWSVLPYCDRRINSWMYSKPERSFASRDELKMFNAEWIGTKNVEDSTIFEDSVANNLPAQVGNDEEPEFIDMDLDLDMVEIDPQLQNRTSGVASGCSPFKGHTGGIRQFSTHTSRPGNDNNDIDFDFGFDDVLESEVNDADGQAYNTSNSGDVDASGIQVLSSSLAGVQIEEEDDDDDNDDDNEQVVGIEKGRFVSTSTNLEGDTRYESSEEEESEVENDIFTAKTENFNLFAKSMGHSNSIDNGSPITSVTTSSENEEDSGIDTDDIEQSDSDINFAGDLEARGNNEAEGDNDEDTTVVHHGEGISEFKFGNIFKSALFPIEVEKRIKSKKTKDSTDGTKEIPESLSFEQRVNKFEMISGGIPGFFKKAVKEFRIAGAQYQSLVTRGKSKRTLKSEELDDIKEKVKEIKEDSTYSLSLLNKTKIKLYQETLIEMQYEAEFRDRIIHPEEVWMRRNKENLQTWHTKVERQEKKLYFLAFMKHYINIIESFDCKDYTQVQLESIAKICIEFDRSDLDVVKMVAARYGTYV